MYTHRTGLWAASSPQVMDPYEDSWIPMKTGSRMSVPPALLSGVPRRKWISDFTFIACHAFHKHPLKGSTARDTWHSTVKLKDAVFQNIRLHHLAEVRLVRLAFRPTVPQTVRRKMKPPAASKWPRQGNEPQLPGHFILMDLRKYSFWQLF